MRERQTPEGDAESKAERMRRGTAADATGTASMPAEKRQKRVEAIQLSLF